MNCPLNVALYGQILQQKFSQLMILEMLCYEMFWKNDARYSSWLLLYVTVQICNFRLYGAFI